MPRKNNKHKDRVKNIVKKRIPKGKKLKTTAIKLISHMDDDMLGMNDVATLVYQEDKDGKPVVWETRQLTARDFEDEK